MISQTLDLCEVYQGLTIVIYTITTNVISVRGVTK